MKQYTRRELVDLIQEEIKDEPELASALYALQDNTYRITIPKRYDRLLPEQYPLAINEENILLTPEQQSVLNEMVVSQKGNYQSELDVSDSYFRDTVVRKAKAISEGQLDIKGMFIQRNYRYELKSEYQNILLYSPIIVTNNEMTLPSPEIKETYGQIRADFIAQYHKIERMMEGFESYRQEVLFFEREPDYFDKVATTLRELRAKMKKDRKLSEEIDRKLREVQKQLDELVTSYHEVSDNTPRLGKFILDRAKARQLKDLEKGMGDMQSQMFELNKDLSNLKSSKLMQKESVAELRKERERHSRAREELDQMIEKGLVIPSETATVAPWNTEDFNNARHRLYDLAVMLIKAFEQECRNLGIEVKWPKGVYSYEEFLDKYERYGKAELGTVIVSNTVSVGKGLLCGYYAKRSLQILPAEKESV